MNVVRKPAYALVLLLGFSPFAAAQQGDITVWGWKAAMDVLKNSGVLERFTETYPDIGVEVVEYEPGDLVQQLSLAITAGVGAPDVALLESSALAQMVDFGGLADLTEQVAPYRESVNTFKWAQADLDGSTYAMPWDSGPVVLYYRRDVFEAAGLPSDPAAVSELVATWDSYLETCQTIKEAVGNDCFAQNKANNTARFHEMMLWQQGLGYYGGDEIMVDSEQNVATLETLGKFWDAGLVSDQLEWTDGWYSSLASTDKPVATLMIASWMGTFLKDWIAPGTEGLWGVALMPALDPDSPRAANDGGSNFVIPAQSSNQEAAWAFIEFVLGDRENQLDIFAISDFLPSLETTYDAPIFAEADPFFADQEVRQTYIDVARQIPDANIYGPNYGLMRGHVATAVQKYATGALSAEAALQEAAEAIRRDLQ